jgi:NAD(P)-dependent dehydrogenase (short-subunit alcohol dehydrogenase family)
VNQTARFDGKVAVISGVGRVGQLGETVAHRFALLGATVVLLNRGPEVHDRAAELRGSGAQVLAMECDLTDPVATARAADATRDFGGGQVHALVCLAGGFATTGDIATGDVADWNSQISINLTTAYITTRAFLPLVRSGTGSIVYFASASALPGSTVAKMAAYAASKSGVVALMRAVAQEERDAHVRSNALAPTAIRTQTNLDSMGSRPSYVERQDVAEWVTFLCSPPGDAVSGQVIRLGQA